MKRQYEVQLAAVTAVKPRRFPAGRQILRDKWLYMLLVPGVLYFLLFKYVPMFGLAIAFQDYKPHIGFLESPWVGLKHFERFFTEPQFWMLFRNTFVLAMYNLVFFFPLPIILALMLNEVRREAFKRFVQTMLYLPHFVSWVVAVGIFYVLLTTEGGIINDIIARLGFEKIPFLLSEEWFRTMIISQSIWKEAGWGTIIFLAALSGVDLQLYEAARIDGAGRWRQLWHVTLPAIRSTIVILFILRLGSFLDTGFEHIFLMLNSVNREVGEVFDTYVYLKGLTQAQYSYSAAVGLFKSAVGLVLVLGANWLAKKFGEEGVY
ncbi:ABC transporter permease [Paenibacillus mucilaginosus]|uniref:Protein lplB n=2 Tax=Paenibacillus mucilaginosus TaxID=61624 RepID=I0BRA4_9BACL|nr:sugar ABC transporter permease [Paenibacillus mucilaginosus]AEI44821.1 YteP6 [Paenibacillus mucilaginosus KNP414]AFH64901.1 protein lplB [Paenibacillus mucilaginosus K02]MCG7214868.1 sugar ABC transporter permease [Paenibacillus mucilaginosus]WDM26348.1 sugar ABC transporter permease [Paenibacillus mucilaginosus]